MDEIKNNLLEISLRSDGAEQRFHSKVFLAGHKQDMKSIELEEKTCEISIDTFKTSNLHSQAESKKIKHVQIENQFSIKEKDNHVEIIEDSNAIEFLKNIINKDLIYVKTLQNDSSLFFESIDPDNYDPDKHIIVVDDGTQIVSESFLLKHPNFKDAPTSFSPKLTDDQKKIFLKPAKYLVISDSALKQLVNWIRQQKRNPLQKAEEKNEKKVAEEKAPILSELRSVRENLNEFYRLLHKHPETEQFKPIIDDLGDYKQFLSQIIELLSSERELSWSDIVITQVRQLSKEKKLRLNLETLKKETTLKDQEISQTVEINLNKIFERANEIISLTKPFSLRNRAPDYKP